MNDRHSGQSSYEALYPVAEQQAGYFTTGQAKDAAFSQRQLAYYVKARRFQRIRTGIYRLTLFPNSPHEDLFVAWLEAGPDSAISHESALALYELSDVIPTQTHLTIPLSASRRHHGLRLHTGRLGEGEVTWFSGLRVTTVLRTLGDVARAGLAEELVIQAVHEAIRRGLATRESLEDAARLRGGRARSLIYRALQEEGGEVR